MVTRFGARKPSDHEARNSKGSKICQPRAIFGTVVLPTSEKSSKRTASCTSRFSRIGNASSLNSDVTLRSPLLSGVGLEFTTSETNGYVSPCQSVNWIVPSRRGSRSSLNDSWRYSAPARNPADPAGISNNAGFENLTSNIFSSVSLFLYTSTSVRSMLLSTPPLNGL